MFTKSIWRQQRESPWELRGQDPKGKRKPTLGITFACKPLICSGDWVVKNLNRIIRSFIWHDCPKYFLLLSIHTHKELNSLLYLGCVWLLWTMVCRSGIRNFFSLGTQPPYCEKAPNATWKGPQGRYIQKNGHSCIIHYSSQLRQPKCLSALEGVNRLWYVHTMDPRENENKLLCATICVNHTNIILSWK